MKKYTLDFIVKESLMISDSYALITLTPAGGAPVPHSLPGQFVQVATGDKGTFLRRPISINDVDHEANTMSLLVREAGDGTRWMISRRPGDTMSIILPLGNGFDIKHAAMSDRFLLVGGGVGIAPMLYLARALNAKGIRPTVLIGARDAAGLLLRDRFASIADLYFTTEDGSEGVKGFVTHSDAWTQPWDKVYCCGPVPMMKAVARICRDKETACEVSLENMMACGIGACLCCVEKTVKGNVCVCSEGPVFSTEQLTWS